MKYFEVHSYGRCLKNKDEPPKGTRSPNENKRYVLSQYKSFVSTYWCVRNVTMYNDDVTEVLMLPWLCIQVSGI